MISESDKVTSTYCSQERLYNLITRGVNIVFHKPAWSPVTAFTFYFSACALFAFLCHHIWEEHTVFHFYFEL